MIVVLVVTVALGTSMLGVLGVAAWWLDKLIKREADSLHQLAEDQSRRLASVHAELHHTRVHRRDAGLRRGMPGAG